MNEDYAILFITLNGENKIIQRTRYLKCELAIPNSMQVLRLLPPNRAHKQSLKLTRDIEMKIRRPYVKILKIMRNREEEVNIKKFKRELIKLGKAISKNLLKAIISGFDIDLDSERNMAIALDSDTAKIPWELGFISETHFRLCDKFDVGRLRIVEDYSWHRTNETRRSAHALVVGINYKNSPINTEELEYAEDEAAKVEEILTENGLKVISLLGKKATRDRILKELRRGVKIFHFTGHGNMAKEVSSIFAYDGELTTIDFINSLEETPAPSLSFMNACETSTEFSTVIKQANSEWESYNWAFAMADAGGRAFIGTFWPISDSKETQLFSYRFYREFLDKDNSIAKSLRKARELTNKKDETIGYAYVLYGPPTLMKKDLTPLA